MQCYESRQKRERCDILRRFCAIFVVEMQYRKEFISIPLCKIYLGGTPKLRVESLLFSLFLLFCSVKQIVCNLFPPWEISRKSRHKLMQPKCHVWMSWALSSSVLLYPSVYPSSVYLFLIPQVPGIIPNRLLFLVSFYRSLHICWRLSVFFHFPLTKQSMFLKLFCHNVDKCLLVISLHSDA